MAYSKKKIFLILLELIMIRHMTDYGRTQSNWGHIEAPEEFMAEIKQIYDEFSNNG